MGEQEDGDAQEGCITDGAQAQEEPVAAVGHKDAVVDVGGGGEEGGEGECYDDGRHAAVRWAVDGGEPRGEGGDGEGDGDGAGEAEAEHGA